MALELELTTTLNLDTALESVCTTSTLWKVLFQEEVLAADIYPLNYRDLATSDLFVVKEITF